MRPQRESGSGAAPVVLRTYASVGKPGTILRFAEYIVPYGHVRPVGHCLSFHAGAGAGAEGFGGGGVIAFAFIQIENLAGGKRQILS